MPFFRGCVSFMARVTTMRWHLDVEYLNGGWYKAMASNRYTVTAQTRDGGTRARALRRQQMVPGVVYGRDFEPRQVQFPYLTIERLIQRAGTSSIIGLSIEGEPEPYMALIRAVQRDPVTDRIMHVDFYRVVAGQTIRSSVPVVQEGESPIAAADMATITQLLDAVEVECLPADMPQSIVVDISGLTELSDRITAADLVVPENVRILTPPDTEIIQVTALRAEEEEEVAEVEEGAEVEAGAEAEAGGAEAEEGAES
jgi:large subunit ribosomal protein L25